MNDRMYELINEAFIGTDDGKLSETNTVYNVEQFIKLIGKECVKLCEQQANARQMSADFNYRIGCYDCQKLIKDFFGIKE